MSETMVPDAPSKGALPLVDPAFARGVIAVAVVIALGAFFFGLVAWRGASGRPIYDLSSGPSVGANLAVANHTVAPVFGGDMTVRCQLPVHNWWDQPIQFIEVIPSCGCSTAKLTEDILEPGEQTFLSVEVKLPPVGGRRTIWCDLLTDKGQKAVHRFEAVAYPHVQLATEKGHISVDQMYVGDSRTVEAQFRIHGARGSKLPVIGQIRSNTADVEASITSVGSPLPLPDGSGNYADVTARVQVKPSNRPGRYARDLTVDYKTANGDSGSAHAVVTWEVKSLFRSTPPRLFIQATPSKDSTVKRTVVLSTIDGREFKILSANASVPWMEINMIPDGQSAEHALAVTLRPHLVDHTSFAELGIDVDHPIQSKLTIPISIAIEKNEEARVESQTAFPAANDPANRIPTY